MMQHSDLDGMNLSLVSGLLHIAAATVVSTGRTVSVGGIHYFIPPWSVGKVGNAPIPDDDNLLPITVVNTATMSFNDSSLSDVLVNSLERDDVIQEEFLKGMLLDSVTLSSKLR